MKKMIYLLILLLVTGCSPKMSASTYLQVAKDVNEYKYTVDGYQQTFSYKMSTIVDNDNNFNIVYSLNPIVENKDKRALVSRLFFANDEISHDLKNQIYNLAYYGYGYFQLNPVGLSKQLAKQPLNKEDYIIYQGDFINQSNVANQDTILYYLAAQELIWESIPNPKTKTNFNITFQDVDLSAQKEEILQLLVNKKITPYFSGNILTIKAQDIEEQTVFTYEDENNVLPGFEVIPSDGIEIVEVIDNKLSFKVTAPFDQMHISFVDRFPLAQKHTLLFSSDENISYLVIGKDLQLRNTATLDIEMAAFQKDMVLKIPTHDAHTFDLLAGAQYQVSLNLDFKEYRQSTISTLEEPATLTGLVPGTYYIRQIVAPEGYLLNETPQRIRIAGGISAIEFGFTNEAVEK